MAKNIVPIGIERQVNVNLVGGPDEIAGSQNNPVVITLANGNFLVAYSAPAGSQDYTVVEQFDQSGTLISGSSTFGTSSSLDAAALAGGGHVLAGSVSGDALINVSRPGAADVLFTAVGSTFGAALTDPTVAVFADGRYFVAAEDDLSQRIRFSVVNATATDWVVKDGFIESTTMSIRSPDAAAAGNNVVVAYSSADTAVKLKLYQSTPNGVAEMDAETVDSAAGTVKDLPDVAALGDGRFVIVWQTTNVFGQTDIQGRIYNPAVGAFSGNVFTVSARTGNQSDPAVAALPDGGFLVTWSDDSHQLGDANGLAVHARRFDATGIATGDEFRVNGGVVGDQLASSVAVNGTGRVFTVWTNSDPAHTSDNSGTGIQGQLAQVATEVVTGTNSFETITAYGLNETINALGGNDTVYALAGHDRLDGGLGADNLVGGLGNDTYVVDNPFDAVFESAGQGTDAVQTSVSFALAAGQSIDLLTTTNAAAVAAINLTGNELAQRLTGNNGANILSGGLGADVLQGLLGNDIYVLENANDTVVDTGGIDTITATVTRTLTSYANIENLTLLGAANISGTGNALANTLTGNNGINILDGGANNDVLRGLGGNDILIGSAGRDTMTGGAGNDVFRFAAAAHSGLGANADVITDFDDSGDDRIDLSAVFGPALAYRQDAAFTAAGQVRINDIAGADLIVEVNTGGSLAADMQIRLTATLLASMAASDFIL